AGENIGLGDVEHLADQARVERAAQRGGADAVVATLPQRYQTMLGGWFESGQELSAGQWQKIAISRAFMRGGGGLVFDEPTGRNTSSSSDSRLWPPTARRLSSRTDFPRCEWQTGSPCCTTAQSRSWAATASCSTAAVVTLSYSGCKPKATSTEARPAGP